MVTDSQYILKRYMESLHDSTAQFDDVEITTDKHNLWSTKKLITLVYYIRSYLQIMRKYKFKKIHYVDLFAGSGLLRIKDEIIPGTSLIPLLRTKELVVEKPELIFDEYHASDSNEEYVQALRNRVNKIRNGLDTSIDISQSDFADSVDRIFSGTPPKYENSKDNAYLVVLDPYGFDIDWQHLQQILQSGSVDIFITFPTTNVKRNQNISDSEPSLNKLYGDSEWKKCETKEDFVNLYCKKIESVDTKWKPFKTKTIAVHTTSGEYHLICASRSAGAENIFSDMQQKFNDVDNDLLNSVFDIAVKKNQQDLNSYL